VAYAVDYLKGMIQKLEAAWPRRTAIESFSKIAAKEAARRDVALRYDGESGYLGTAVSSGEKLLEVSAFDRILIVRHSGMYSVVDVPEKLFVDQGLLWVAIANKEEINSTLLTIVYRAPGTGFPYIKRTSIETWIIAKDYSLIPEGAQMLLFSTEKDFEFTLTYAKKPRTKKNDETFKTKNYGQKGMKAAGVRLATREVLDAVSSAKRVTPVGPNAPELEVEAVLGNQAEVRRESLPEKAVKTPVAKKSAAPKKVAKPAKTVKPARREAGEKKPRLAATPEETARAKAEIARVQAETEAKVESIPHGLFAALARKKAELASDDKDKSKGNS
ncbi:MAG: hypothetical protein WC784_05765, partial [Candidatus Shapirobacteria bacterium]